MASFTFGPGHPFPPTTVVQAYEDKGQNPSGQPTAGAPVASGTVDASGGLSIAGLTIGNRYWAVALVSGVWRWLRIYIQKTPEPPGEGEIVRGKDLSAVGAGGVSVLTAQGPLTQGDVDALISAGTTLFETDAAGNVVAQWVKTSA